MPKSSLEGKPLAHQHQPEKSDGLRRSRAHGKEGFESFLPMPLHAAYASGARPSSMISPTSDVTAFDLNGFTQELAGLTRVSGLAATVTNTSATASTLNLNVSGASSYAYAGLLAGNLALTMSGTGTETLSAANPTPVPPPSPCPSSTGWTIQRERKAQQRSILPFPPSILFAPNRPPALFP